MSKTDRPSYGARYVFSVIAVFIVLITVTANAESDSAGAIEQVIN